MALFLRCVTTYIKKVSTAMNLCKPISRFRSWLVTTLQQVRCWDLGCNSKHSRLSKTRQMAFAVKPSKQRNDHRAINVSPYFSRCENRNQVFGTMTCLWL